MKCDIIIPVWNQLSLTKTCIENLIKNTNYPFRLILIDNGSEDETRRYLESLEHRNSLDIRLIHNEENLGFVKAVNQGLKISSAPYVCILNNDTVPAPYWLRRMVEFAEANKDVGLLNPQCDLDPKLTPEEHAKILESKKGKFMEMNQCFGFCMLIKREIIEKIGYLDEAFGMGCYDDTDYSMRAYRAGYRCVNVHSAYVHHVHGVSFKALGKRDSLVEKGEEVYFKKWPRHLRIGISFSLDKKRDDSEVENLLRGVLFLAREWCWINFWIFGEKEKNITKIAYISEKIKMPVHQNIKFNFFPRKFKNMQLLIRLIERSFGTKRRKKYDIVLIDNEKTFSFLKRFYLLHNTKMHLINLKNDLIHDMDDTISKLRNIKHAM